MPGTTTVEVTLETRDALLRLQRELGRGQDPPRVSVSADTAIRALLEEQGADTTQGGTMISFEVRGVPAPQGSKRHVGNGRMIEQSRAVGPWRDAVRAETQRAMTAAGRPPLAGPVRVTLRFRLARPASTPRKVRWPAKRPDADKLARSTLDGLVAGGALADDGLIVRLAVDKDYGTPSCLITIEEMETS